MNEPTQHRQNGGLIQAVGWASVAAGIGMIAWLGVYLYPGVMSYQVRSWPHAQAVVADGSVSHGDIFQPREKRGRMPHSTVEIRYTYRVDGRDYTGTRFSPYGDSVPEDKWFDLLQNVQIGPTYEIYYNPDDPSESYFTHAYRPPGFWEITGIVFVVLLGSCLTHFGVRMVRRSKAQPLIANDEADE
jgi:hypothetical protein